MPVPGFLRRKRTYLIGIPILVLLVAVVAPYVYIHFIEGPAPEKLTLSDPDSSRATTTTGSDGSAEASSDVSVDGTWKVTKDGTVVGYRVDEVLFGQSATAVGRTNAVTGELTIGGTTVTAGRFTADLTKVTSDRSNRDGQFQGRIMDTATYPTATFELTAPIPLSSIPQNLVKITEKASGDLTLRGKTRPVSFDVVARRNGDKIEVNGSIPITFADWGIPNPSFGPASTEDHGILEFILVFTRRS
ncbi:MAG TPA: YceI family protein [Acidimicrobiia bacterium]|nr:YceI family protein [Acidimicrobiia bacterium]